MIGTPIRVAETFVSVQGEGHGPGAGVPMFFVRLQGCSVARCPIRDACDAEWRSGTLRTVESVRIEALASGRRWVCITGGEPLDQAAAVAELVDGLRQKLVSTMLQTSGAKPWPLLTPRPSWTVVSPKLPADELEIRQADEVKLVYTGQRAEEIQSYRAIQASAYVLQPFFDGASSNEAATAVAVLDLGHPWRFGLQAHRYARLR